MDFSKTFNASDTTFRVDVVVLLSVVVLSLVFKRRFNQTSAIAVLHLANGVESINYNMSLVMGLACWWDIHASSVPWSTVVMLMFTASLRGRSP
jgi:hypothetical protein